MNITKRRSEEAVHSHKKRLLGRQIVARPCRTLALTDSQKSSGALESLPGSCWEAEVLENFLAYFRTAHEKTDQPMNQSFAPTSDTGVKKGENFLPGFKQRARLCIQQSSWKKTPRAKNLEESCSESPRKQFGEIIKKGTIL